MNDILRMNREQIYQFVGDDPDAVRVIEQLLRVVNELQAKVADLESRVEALETP